MSRISVLTSYAYPEVYSTTTIQAWLNTIRAETNFNKEWVLQARSDLKNKDVYKPKMICVTPHATFRGWGTTKNFVSCSSHILIDLDQKENPGVVAFKDSLADIEFVRAAWVSASGTGLALLVEVDGMTDQNFKSTMSSLHDYFLQRGITPDAKMKSIVSKNAVSYDPDIIIKESWMPFPAVHDIPPEQRNDTYISIAATKFQEHPLETAIRLAGEYAAKKPQRLLYKTQENFEDGEAYHVYPEGRDWLRIFYPQTIPDGRRHLVLHNEGLKLVELNPTMTRETFVAMMKSLNKRCKPPLDPKDLDSIINWVWRKKLNNEIDWSFRAK